MHELFDHTADIGIRAEGADPSELFAEAGRGLMAVIVEEPGAARVERRIEIELSGEAPEDLLYDWLSELLYTFEVEGVVVCGFDVRVEAKAGAWSLKAACEAAGFDPGRHGSGHEVKAVTYHGLKVERIEGDRWRAEVIVDI